MASQGPNWEGMLKWSLAHSDGTGPNRSLSEEDRKFFMEAMQAQTIDVVKRMKEITFVMKIPQQDLEAQGVTPADIEDLLGELQEHVESIDMANDLHSIGGLAPLLGFLKSPHAKIRAKAAEVVAAIVQNNPKSQQLVMGANGLEQLIPLFTSDIDVFVQTKALGAISSLIRDNKPGISAFLLANGYAALRDALASECVRFQRRALNLINFLLRENTFDCNIMRDLALPHMMVDLASSKDLEVREGALRGLLELAQKKTDGVNNTLAEEDENLKQRLQKRIEAYSLMCPGELGAAREERQLVDSIWNTCYNEPSPLREKGLLVLPGEDELPPDVTASIFEPVLRAIVGN